MNKNPSPLLRSSIVILSVICILVLWKVCAYFVNSPLVLPSPESVASCIVELCSSSYFWKAASNTFLRVAAAFCLSAALGVAVGAVCARWKWLWVFLKAPLAVVGATPVVSVILVCLFWLGSSNVPVLCGVLMALPVMVNSSYKGFTSCSKTDFDFAKCYGLSQRQILYFIKLPKSVPYIQSGIKSSSSMVWKVCAAAEVIAVPKNAIGAMMQRSQATLETRELFALTVLIVFFSCVWSVVLKVIFMLAQKSGGFFRELYFSSARNYSSKHIEFDPHLAVCDFTSTRSLCYSHFSYDFSGKKTAVTSPSGSGKTTLLDFVAGALEDEQVAFGSVEKNQHTISYSFQTPYVLEGLTVRQNLLLVLTNVMELHEAQSLVEKFLDDFQLGEKSDASASKLSGGQKERVSLAMALLFPSKILLLDEPFKSQDWKLREKLLDVVVEGKSLENRTCILVTHDRTLAEALKFDVIQLGSENNQ